MSGKIKEPNKNSSKKIKKLLLSAYRSSFKRKKRCRRDPGVSSNLCDAENLALSQKYSDNYASILGSDTSVSVGSTNSVSRDLYALNEPSERKTPEEVSEEITTKFSEVIELDVTPKSYNKKPNIDEPDVTSKPSEETNKQLDDPLDTPEETIKYKQLDGYVGFANLPNQIYRRAVQKGFEFTLMVVGQSGLGKSTLINSMFLTDIYNATDYPGPTQRCKKTVSVEATRVTLKQNGVKLDLTVVDTPGFGDAVNNVNSWAPVIEFIESKYEAYLTSESRVNRTTISDQRVHCCLYFIQPSGHGLQSLDIEFMKRIHDKVNIVPIIAKADTLTEEECYLFKRQIMREIAEHDIKIYKFPDVSTEDDEYQLNKSLKDKVPFAVVGANTLIEVNGRKVRGRRYPWGVVDIENMDHCDFIALRKMVVGTHMQDLKDVTHFLHYENYRRESLSKSSLNGEYHSTVEIINEELEHESKIQKMKCEIEQICDVEVRERMREQLRKYENKRAKVTKVYEIVKRNIEEQVKDLEEKYKQLGLEKHAWECRK